MDGAVIGGSKCTLEFCGNFGVSKRPRQATVTLVRTQGQSFGLTVTVREDSGEDAFEDGSHGVIVVEAIEEGSLAVGTAGVLSSYPNESICLRNRH